MELSGSRLLGNLLRSLKLCDLCQCNISLIIDEEEKDTIVSTLSQLTVGKGLTIIQDPQKYKALSKRVGVFVEDGVEFVRDSYSFVTEQLGDNNNDEEHGYNNDEEVDNNNVDDYKDVKVNSDSSFINDVNKEMELSESEDEEYQGRERVKVSFPLMEIEESIRVDRKPRVKSLDKSLAHFTSYK